MPLSFASTGPAALIVGQDGYLARRLSTGALGPWRVANPPQDSILPHNFRRIAFVAHECLRHGIQIYGGVGFTWSRSMYVTIARPTRRRCSSERSTWPTQILEPIRTRRDRASSLPSVTGRK